MHAADETINHKSRIGVGTRVAIVALTVAALVGCGGSDDDGAKATTTAVSSTVPGTTAPATPPTGSSQNVAVKEHAAALEAHAADAPELAPLVLPVTLPPGWRYTSLEDRNDATGPSLRILFGGNSGASALVLACITLEDGCPTPGPDFSVSDVEVEGLDNPVRLYGDDESLAAWESIAWTTDPTEVDW